MDGFRGQYRYNYLDENYRNLNAICPHIFTWDDHETKNNWWPLSRVRDARYREKSLELLSRWSKRAFFEYLPVAQTLQNPSRIYRRLSQGPLLDIFVLDTRSYRGPNSTGRQKRTSAKSALMGNQQLQWLVDELGQSKALWKIIVCPQPIGFSVFHTNGRYDGIANGVSDAPRGRELEFAQLFSAMRARKVSNVVWLTADVHYAAAHHYTPSRARFKDFDPFWEFVAGPINAGNFGPNPSI